MVALDPCSYPGSIALRRLLGMLGVSTLSLTYLASELTKSFVFRERFRGFALGKWMNEAVTLLREKLSVLRSSVRNVCDVEALTLGSEFSGYIFPEIYEPELGAVASFVVMDFEREAIYAICRPIQAPSIQDVYGDLVEVLVVDPREVVEIGAQRFRSEVDALSKVLDGVKRVGYAGRVPIDKLLGFEWIGVDSVVRTVRMRKVESEIKRIQRAIEIAERSLKELISDISPGVSELELSRKLVDYLIRFGADGEAFPTIVAIGRSSREPHHIPLRSVKFEGKQPILIDFGARYMGYRSDITRMIVPKSVDGDYSKVLDVCNAVLDAIKESIAVLRGGVSASEVFEVACKVLSARGGYDKVFIHGLGHGIGVDVHEEPYLSSRWSGRVVEGAVVTIEPGAYLSTFGVRIEEDVLVQSGGSLKLSRLDPVIEL